VSLTGMPVNSQVLVKPRHPVGADTLGAPRKGADTQEIPTIKRAVQLCRCNTLLGWPLSVCDVPGNIPLETAKSSFVPNRGWTSKLGRKPASRTPGREERGAR